MQKVFSKADETIGSPVRGEAELLELENVYCSHGDTVHYTNPPKIFDRCDGSFMYDANFSTFRCGIRRSTSVIAIRV
jgi:hypothetical protein